MITDPTLSAPSPPGTPPPRNILPPSGRINIWTRRRAAAVAGTAPPAAEHGFGPGGTPRPSTRRANTPPRAPRLQLPAPVVMAPAPASLSIPTVPLPSGPDRAEPAGTPFLRVSPLTDTPPFAMIDLNTLGAAAEFLFGDPAARYSHADMVRKKQADPGRNAHALPSLWPTGSLISRRFVVFPFPLAPSFFGGSRAG